MPLLKILPIYFDNENDGTLSPVDQIICSTEKKCCFSVHSISSNNPSDFVSRQKQFGKYALNPIVLQSIERVKKILKAGHMWLAAHGHFQHVNAKFNE